MIEVRRADGRTAWDDLVRASPQGTPFHLRGALAVAARHSGGEVHRLVGYEDGEPVGVFPACEVSKGPISVVLSPPPGLKMSYGGPLLLAEGLSPTAAEQRHRAFVDACLSYVEAELSPEYVHLRTAPGYDDTRVLTEQGFDVSLRYTYVVDLTLGTDRLLREFSSDARRNVRDGGPEGVTVTVGDDGALRRIIEQVRERHDELEVEYPLTPAFVSDLRRALPDGALRPYVCTVDGEFAGGRVALESNGTVYGWQGGAKTAHDAPVTDLVDWAVIRDGVDRGLSSYDLVGANNARTSEYKAKFAPTLVRYYQLERGSLPVRAVAHLYRRLL